jgi:hypothetical protein
MTKYASTPQNQSAMQNASHKDHPTCSHFGVIGHTVEKCYIVHRYPLGYKFNKGKSNSHFANQAFKH